MLKPEQLKTTHIIRNNEGMIRDCFWIKDLQSDHDEYIFVIRQVNTRSEQVKMKEIRLTEIEAKEIANQILKGEKQ